MKEKNPPDELDLDYIVFFTNIDCSVFNYTVEEVMEAISEETA